LPTSICAKVWSPNTALGLSVSKMPSSSIIFAPPFSPGGGPSSAGWKMNITVPGKSARMAASVDATPSWTAT
jgi:hypothetical protein